MKRTAKAGMLVAIAAVTVALGRFVLHSPTAVAAPVLGSGTFSLPNVAETQTIFTNQTTDPVGVAVSVSSGTALVENSVSGTWSSLGSVLAGEFCVFEGAFESVRVKAMAPSTAGAYANRGPTNNTEDSDHAVGTGAVSLNSGPVRVYTTASPTWRNVFVTAGTADLELRATSTGPALVEIPAGGMLHYRGSHAAFWVTGADVATVSILDDPASGTWMLLPTAHWTDQFSPLYATSTDGYCEGNPGAEPATGREGFEYEWENPYTQETEVRVAVQNIVFVNFQPTVSASEIEEILGENNLAIVTAWFDPDPLDPETSMSWFQCEILEESEYHNDVFGMIEHLQSMPEVEFAEPNGVAKLGSVFPDDPPNDEYFDEQPEFERLNALAAWKDYGYGNDNPVGVAIMDSGVDVDHEDLADKIFAHPKKAYRMGVRAWSESYKVGNVDSSDEEERAILRTIDLYTDKEDNYEEKPNAHGTAMAGIAGAATNNNEVGVAGCGPAIQVLPVSVQELIISDVHFDGLDPAAVVYAVKALDKQFFKGKHIKNLKVVNFSSWGDESTMKSVTKAMKRDSKDNKRLYVAIAGNDADEVPSYPAADAKILGVTAADYSESSGDYWSYDEHTGFGSNYWDGGGEGSDPVLDVYGISGYWTWSKTTDISGSTGFNSGDYATNLKGTSGAAAQISALAALMWSLHSDLNYWSVEDVQDILKVSTKGEDYSVIEFMGGDKAIPGVVDFHKAMQAAFDE